MYFQSAKATHAHISIFSLKTVTIAIFPPTGYETKDIDHVLSIPLLYISRPTFTAPLNQKNEIHRTKLHTAN